MAISILVTFLFIKKPVLVTKKTLKKLNHPFSAETLAYATSKIKAGNLIHTNLFI